MRVQEGDRQVQVDGRQVQEDDYRKGQVEEDGSQSS